ncbi:MAG: N-acetylneuraminate synthase family protein [Anaerolineae bacterium]|nr:N-acetylneuraminate synthase family protein [Anaerolineae bacterium]
MSNHIEINGKKIGHDFPAYIIGEIGINHNGDLDIARRLIAAAHDAGMDAVKFQKRTPLLCVPEEQKNQMRETPWGYITYLDYRYKVEFDKEQYLEIDRYCRELGITWFASVWDVEAVDFMEDLNTCAYKVASASLTDHALLTKIRATGKPVILSTGMSTMEEIRAAVQAIGQENLVILHTTSSYPCPPEELNLRMIPNLRAEFTAPIGYSGHEVGLVPSAVAVAMGACVVERHITLDRALWGSDQAASVEPQGVRTLVKYIRVTEQALGDGIKHVYDSELPSLHKLRRI